MAYTLAINLEQIKNDSPVAKLTGQEMLADGKKASEVIADFFHSIGNKVNRKGFGDVLFGQYGVGGLLNHRPLNRSKMVSVAAAPNVIKYGRQISHTNDWKGRGYPSYIFAAPATVNGTPVYVACVVDQRPDNKFYLSEMLDSEGNYVRIEEVPSGNAKSGVTGNATGITARPNGTSSSSIPDAAQNSNRNFEGADNPSVGEADSSLYTREPLAPSQSPAATALPGESQGREGAETLPYGGRMEYDPELDAEIPTGYTDRNALTAAVDELLAEDTKKKQKEEAVRSGEMTGEAFDAWWEDRQGKLISAVRKANPAALKPGTGVESDWEMRYDTEEDKFSAGGRRAQRGRSIELETMENNRFKRLDQFKGDIPEYWYAYTRTKFYVFKNYSYTEYLLLGETRVNAGNREIVRTIEEAVENGSIRTSEDFDRRLADLRAGKGRYSGSHVAAGGGRKTVGDGGLSGNGNSQSTGADGNILQSSSDSGAEGTRLKGENDHGGDNLSDGRGRRDAGTGAGEQAGGVDRSAGKAKARGNLPEQYAKANERRNRGKDLGKVSPKSLGISSGTEQESLAVLPESAWDEELRAIAEEAKKETGKEPIFVVGEIRIRAGEKLKSVLGVRLADGTVIVRADHNRLSAQQIAKHEFFHSRRAWGLLSIPDLRRKLAGRMTAEELRTTVETYMREYAGIINIPENADEETYRQAVNRLYEEIFADAWAGIGRFDTRLTETVAEYMAEQESTDATQTAAATERTTGPPDAFAVDGRTFSYDELTSLPPVEGPILNANDVVPLLPDGRINSPEIIRRVRSECRQVKTKSSAPTYVLHSKALGGFVEIDTHSIEHGYFKAKRRPTKPQELIAAHAELAMADVVEGAIEVNRLAGRDKNIPYSSVLLGTVAIPKGKTVDYYAVRLVVQHRTEQNAILTEYGVIGRLHAPKAKRMSYASGQAVNKYRPLHLRNSFEVSIADLLSQVKEVFDDTLSDDVYQHFGMTRNSTKFADDLMFSVDVEEELTYEQMQRAWEIIDEIVNAAKEAGASISEYHDIMGEVDLNTVTHGELQSVSDALRAVAESVDDYSGVSKYRVLWQELHDIAEQSGDTLLDGQMKMEDVNADDPSQSAVQTALPGESQEPAVRQGDGTENALNGEIVPEVERDMAEQAAKAQGYPVAEGVQIVPNKNYVRCTDGDRNNYGLVIGKADVNARGEQMLWVMFKNKEEGTRATTKAIAVSDVHPVEAMHQPTSEELESLLHSEPEDVVREEPPEDYYDADDFIPEDLADITPENLTPKAQAYLHKAEQAGSYDLDGQMGMSETAADNPSQAPAAEGRRTRPLRRRAKGVRRPKRTNTK